MTKKNNRLTGRLKVLTSEKYPRHLFFYDTETMNNYITETDAIQELRLGIVQYIRLDKKLNIIIQRYELFHSTDELVDFIIDNTPTRETCYIYAHNVGFDNMVTMLPNYFGKRLKKLNPPIRNGMTHLWKLSYRKRILQFVNVANYVQRKLEAIGEDIGFPKLKIDFDNVSENELIEYCKRDTDIIREFMLQYIRFLRDNKLGSYKTTIGSQAMSSYRTRFTENLPYTHEHKEVLDMETLSYKGGRTDCYRIGNYEDIDIYYLDINSMYPYVMLDENLPKRFISIRYNPTDEIVNNLLINRYVIVDCELNCTVPFLGVKYDNKKMDILNATPDIYGNPLIFPTGKVREVLHDSEFRFALENNMITKVHRIAFYERGAIFKNYIEFFNDLKIQATNDNNATYRLLSKLFLNSLYGKFAQKYRWFEKLSNKGSDIDVVDRISYSDSDRISTTFLWFNELWANHAEGLVEHSSPAIAGAVTAKARMLLFNYILEVGNLNVFYTDTDSLIVNKIGYERLLEHISPTELGLLKLEQTEKYLSIKGCKDYMIGSKQVLKGVPKNAIYLGDRTYLYKQFEGFGMWLRRGMDRPPMISTVKKQIKATYDKGIILDSGLVIPYEIQKDKL